MKKIIASVVMFCWLTTSAHAFLPLAIAGYIVGTELAPWALASVSLHVAGAAAGLYYWLSDPSTKSTTVNSAGDISRPSVATWVDTKDLVIKNDPLNARLPYSQVVSLSEKTNSDSSKKYPLSYNKTHGPDAPDISSSSPVGAVVATAWGVRKITSKSATTYCQLNVSSIPTSSNGGSTIVIQDGSQCSGSGSSSHQTIFNTTSATAPVVPVPPSKFVSNLGLPSGGGSLVNSPLQVEIDKMCQDPDYVPAFSDDTTGLPYSPPVDVMSPSQLKSYNVNGIAAEKQQQAVQAATGAATSASAAAGAAHDRYAASGGDPATGQGGDPGLYQQYLDAKARADSAAAAAAGADAAGAAADAQSSDDPGDPTNPAPGEYDGTIAETDKPVKKSIPDYLAQILQSSPLIALARTLTIDTSSQESSVSAVVFGRTLVLDFGPWAWILTFCGGAMLSICHGYAIFIIFRRR